MAFATKYTVTFKDVEDLTWVVSFQEDDWGGAVTTLTPGASPLIMTWHQTEKYQPIVGSSADIQMVYESAIDSLYTESPQTIKVIIERNSIDIWQGFVSPGQYFRNFNKPVHYVTITANDGLGDLKNIKFEDDSGDPFFFQEEEAVVIANCLLKTGLSFNIAESINIFEDNHDTGVDKSPLNQTYIYPEMYWDEETDERGNCYDVLVDILTKYGATLRQRDEQWRIYRPNSYSLDTIYYRTFDSAGAYASNSSYTSYITAGTNFIYMYTDAELTRMAGVGRCEVKQEPPRRSNIINNGSFNIFTW